MTAAKTVVGSESKPKGYVCAANIHRQKKAARFETYEKLRAVVIAVVLMA